MRKLPAIEYTPTELLVHFYNLSVTVFISIFLPGQPRLWPLLMAHLLFIPLWQLLVTARHNHQSGTLIFGAIFSPIALLFFWHYETGLLNRLVFPEFLDHLIISLDKALFGFLPHLVFSHLFSSSFVDQLFHLFYFSYYLFMFLPPLVLYIRESHWARTAPRPPDRLIPRQRTEEMIFGSLLTMFVCFGIFLIFPVKGPTEDHQLLFPTAGGIIRLIDLFYQFGDLDGGAVPSSHVAASLVIVLYSRRYLPALFPYLAVLFILLAFSTVYCSFHYGFDVIFGMLAGLLLFRLSRWLFPRLLRRIKILQQP